MYARTTASKDRLTASAPARTTAAGPASEPVAAPAETIVADRHDPLGRTLARVVEQRAAERHVQRGRGQKERREQFRATERAKHQRNVANKSAQKTSQWGAESVVSDDGTAIIYDRAWDDVPNEQKSDFADALNMPRAAKRGEPGIKKLAGDTGYEIKIIGSGARIFGGMYEGKIRFLKYEPKHQ